MKLIKTRTSLKTIEKAVEKSFGSFVKVVVDIEKEVMVIGG